MSTKSKIEKLTVHKYNKLKVYKLKLNLKVYKLKLN